VNTRVLANVIGRGWNAVGYLLTVPFYLRYLGLDAFGVMSLYVTLVSLSNVLDLGLSSTVNRELARRGADASARSGASLVRTLEVLYGAFGIVAGVVSFAIADAISRSWHTDAPSLRGHLVVASVLIALNVVAQWPVSFYSGAFSGQGRQLELNATLVVAATVQAVGGILALALGPDKLELFLAVQLVVGVFRVAALRTLLWTRLPGPRHFDWGGITPILRFAGQMGFLGILGIVLTQADKLIVGAQVGVRQFSYYGLAATVAGGLSYLSLPVYDVALPMLTATRERAPATLEQAYWKVSRTFVIAVVPLGLGLVLLSGPVLTAWTGKSFGSQPALLLSLLASGTVLNGIFYGPYALLVASAKVSGLVKMNIVFTALYVPGIALLVHLYGSDGAAAMWLGLNACYVLIGAPLLLRRTMPGHTTRWLVRYGAAPALAAAAAAGAVRWAAPTPSGRVEDALLAVVGMALALLATLWVMPRSKRLVGSSG
jgi:O-antigen/teichoic acid export membrane protein